MSKFFYEKNVYCDVMILLYDCMIYLVLLPPAVENFVGAMLTFWTEQNH